MQIRFPQLALWLCLPVLLAAQGWLFYRPFLHGHIPGIYPLAEIYGYVFGFVATALSLIVGYLSPLIAIAALICGCCLWFTRRRIYRRGLMGICALPLMLWILNPAMTICEPSQNLAVTSWGHFYRTAYQTSYMDDDYGQGVIFQCDRSGVVCRKVYEFLTSGADVGAMMPTYDADADLFSLIYYDRVIYLRSQQAELCVADGYDDHCIVETNTLANFAQGTLTN